MLKQELKDLKDDGNKIDHPIEGCFVGSTRILMADGSLCSMEELSKKSVQDFSVRAWKNCELVNVGARNCRVTKSVDVLVRVYLETGECFECTPEHLILTRSGEYRNALHLVKGDWLMPGYINVTPVVRRVEAYKTENPVDVYLS